MFFRRYGNSNNSWHFSSLWNHTYNLCFIGLNCFQLYTHPTKSYNHTLFTDVESGSVSFSRRCGHWSGRERRISLSRAPRWGGRGGAAAALLLGKALEGHVAQTQMPLPSCWDDNTGSSLSKLSSCVLRGGERRCATQQLLVLQLWWHSGRQFLYHLFQLVPGHTWLFSKVELPTQKLSFLVFTQMIAS